MFEVPRAVQKMPNGDYRFFFYTLEQMVEGLTIARKLAHAPITHFYIGDHGLPGGFLSPVDWAQLNSPECAFEKAGLMSPDLNAYNQYYLVSSAPFDQVWKDTLAYDALNASYSDTGLPVDFEACRTDAASFGKIKKVKALPYLFARNAKVDLIMCHSALGKLGRKFLTDLAELFFPTLHGNLGQVRAVDTYLANDGSISGGSVGATDLDTPESYRLVHTWWMSHRDIDESAPFNLYTAEQTGNGVKLSSELKTFWSAD